MRSHVRFYCRRVCMRLINRENRNLKGVDLTMRSTPGMARLGVMAAAFYRDDRFMYMPLDHSCTILFLAQLFTVITKTVTVLSLLLCPPTQSAVSYTRYTQRWWAVCYFAFSKHASGFVIAKLLNEFSIPQRNCDSKQKHERESERVCRERDTALGQMQYSWPLTPSVHFVRTREGSDRYFLLRCITVSKQYRATNEYRKPV